MPRREELPSLPENGTLILAAIRKFLSCFLSLCTACACTCSFSSRRREVQMCQLFCGLVAYVTTCSMLSWSLIASTILSKTSYLCCGGDESISTWACFMVCRLEPNRATTLSLSTALDVVEINKRVCFQVSPSSSSSPFSSLSALNLEEVEGCCFLCAV